MGLVLDSSVLIAAEREARPVSELLLELEQQHGETEIILSTIGVIGWSMASTAPILRKSASAGEITWTRPAARIDAEARKTKSVIPFPDLLIGITSLHFDYSIATRNPRHFQLIPGLKVISL